MMKQMHARLAGSTGMLLAAAVAAGCAREASQQAVEQKSAVADLALRNGAIYTVDGARSWAETIAIDDGRIVYVGNDAGAKDYVGPQTQVVDLKGRMVLPGMQDAHVHPISGGHRGERLRPERGHDGRGIRRHHQEIRRRAPRRAVDQGRRLADVRVRPGRARAQGTDRRGRARPAGHPLEPRRPHDLGQQQGARAGGHHQGHEGPAGRPDRPRPEDRRAESAACRKARAASSPTRRRRTRTRRATRACATPSRC